MSSLHWLILFPYYFFTALSLYLLFALVCRIVRADAAANTLAITAVLCSLAATAAPLLMGLSSLADYSWQGLVVLLLVSSSLAAVDALLKGGLPLRLDKELEDV